MQNQGLVQFMLPDKKNKPLFSKHMRLEIYKYLDTKTCITHVTQLSKSERESLMNSFIVREGRIFRLKLNYEDFQARKKLFKKTLDLRYGVSSKMYKESKPFKLEILEKLVLYKLIERIEINVNLFEQQKIRILNTFEWRD